MDNTTVELLNQVSGFLDIAEWMEDEELENALAIVAKIIMNPDIPPQKATNLIVQLQAYSVKFAMLASWNAHVNKDNRAKKNIYYSARDAIDRLVDSLKYSTRSYYG